ncbi:hypothetical protein FA95DRAFT_1501415 [Auriscalpium vulgare]|uniref:Uncharacterized protein n=1 Tax=Auriscalpium vulgare TaxID=40419 RepID=A0ACB8RD45_9AGAM|nr:hypothetical protein FA95DRAFT_1501415 [Auriscalpium vulgare]
MRAAFMNRFALEVPDLTMVMFTDESARDERTDVRSRGWSLKGTRCSRWVPFIRGKHVSILPVLILNGIITYDIIEGSVTSERFIQFLREYVLLLTNPYPGPRSVLVLDNCNIHHAEEVRVLVEEEAGMLMLF